MGFNETFWLLVGGSAPVIALAAVVSVRDMNDLKARQVDQLRELIAELHSASSSGTAEPMVLLRLINPLVGRGWALDGLRLLQFLNLCLQSVMLGLALFSVVDQVNILSLRPAALGTIGGLAILALGVTAEGTVRRSYVHKLQSGRELVQEQRAAQVTVRQADDADLG